MDNDTNLPPPAPEPAPWHGPIPLPPIDWPPLIDTLRHKAADYLHLIEELRRADRCDALTFIEGWGAFEAAQIGMDAEDVAGLADAVGWWHGMADAHGLHIRELAERLGLDL